ncbi:MAG: DcrB-related protein [Candidatus Wallbacteria bacterium]
MKKIFSIMALAALLLNFAPAAYAADNQSFNFKHPLYEVKVPEGFMSEDSPVMIFGPTDGDFRVNVNILVMDEKEKNLEQYTQFSLDQMKTVPDVKVIKEGYETYNGVKFYSVVAGFKQNNIAVTTKTIWTISNAKAYVLTYTSNEKLYEKHLKDAETIFSSFALKVKPAPAAEPKNEKSGK